LGATEKIVKNKNKKKGRKADVVIVTEILPQIIK